MNISDKLAGYNAASQEMTRAEAAAMLNSFMEYMQEDLRKEYRHRIFKYR